MENIKLVCLDLDGTTLRKFNNISNRTKKAVIALQKKGIKVAIVSGRSKRGVMKHVQTLEIDKYGGTIANFNGVRIEDLSENKILFEEKISIPNAIEYTKFLKEYKVMPLVYYDSYILTSKYNPIVAKFLKFNENLDLKTVNDLSSSISKSPYKISFLARKKNTLKVEKDIYKSFSDKFHITVSDNYIEVMDKGINKGNSIDILKNFYKIDYENILAFGDEDNDFEMIHKAGTGVAMKNAVDHLKKEADFITASNLNNGVAKFLEKYIL